MTKQFIKIVLLFGKYIKIIERQRPESENIFVSSKEMINFAPDFK